MYAWYFEEFFFNFIFLGGWGGGKDFDPPCSFKILDKGPRSPPIAMYAPAVTNLFSRAFQQLKSILVLAYAIHWKMSKI
jgi:hypothetical protein